MARVKILRRYDAGLRPYWLRDWQSGYGGYASLCFTLLSKMPTHKPWARSSDERDPSRGVRLDLQENWDWKMEPTVLLQTFDPQCVPVYQADQPKWTYRKVPKVSSLRSFAGDTIMV